MRKKTKNVGGVNAYSVRIDMAVTAGQFATHLADEELSAKCNRNESVLEGLTKKKAEAILKNRLYHYGLGGENQTYEDTDWTEEWNTYNEKAYGFIQKHYPFLTQNNASNEN